MRSQRAMQQIVGWVAAGGVALTLLGQVTLSAAEKTAAPRPPARSKSLLSGAALVAALSKLEAQQEEVLRRLEDAKKELGVIKVRAATIPTGISNTGGSCN